MSHTREVYFLPTSGTFIDYHGNEITMQEARKAYEDAKKTGEDLECNLAFMRLIWLDFDLEAAMADY